MRIISDEKFFELLDFINNNNLKFNIELSWTKEINVIKHQYKNCSVLLDKKYIKSKFIDFSYESFCNKEEYPVIAINTYFGNITFSICFYDPLCDFYVIDWSMNNKSISFEEVFVYLDNDLKNIISYHLDLFLDG